MYPLSDTLHGFTPLLHRRLASPAALQRVRFAARRLPAALSDQLYLEFRLGRAASRVDLVLGVDEGGMRGLASARAPSPDARLLGSEPWRRVRKLCQHCLEPENGLGDALRCLWLEFDFPPASAPADAGPLPGVFLDFSPPQGVAPATPALAPLGAALDVLAGGRLAARTAASLARCIASLPAGAHLPYLGMLLPRGGESVRLCVMGMDDDALLRYVAAIGWPGSLPWLSSLLGSVREGAGVAGATVLNLDVGGTVLPTLGLEYAFPRAGQLRGEVRKSALLDHLVARSWCEPEKREALLAFAGADVRRLPHQLWPSVAARHLAHVKLVVAADRVVEAKGYLRITLSPHLPRRTPPLPDRDTPPGS